MSDPTPFTADDVPEADYPARTCTSRTPTPPALTVTCSHRDTHPVGRRRRRHRLDQARTIPLEEDTHRHDSDSTPH